MERTQEEFMAEFDRLSQWRSRWLRLANDRDRMRRMGNLQSQTDYIIARSQRANAKLFQLMQEFDESVARVFPAKTDASAPATSPAWVALDQMAEMAKGWYWAEFPGCWLWFCPERLQVRGIDHGDVAWHPMLSKRYWGPWTSPEPSWMAQAKRDAGYEDTASFEAVWAETLRKARAYDALQQETPGMLPKAGYSRDTLERMGITFGAEVSRLFVAVKLPAGWSVQAADQPFWSVLRDHAQRHRAWIFHKEEGRDSSAHLVLLARYRLNTDEPCDVDGNPQKRGEHTHVQTVVLDGGVILKCFGIRCETDDTQVKRDRFAAKQWLTANFPDWKDVTAYW